MPGRYRRSFRALGRCLGIALVLLAGSVKGQTVGNAASTKASPQQGKQAVAPNPQPILSPAVEDSIKRAASALEAANNDPKSADKEKRDQDDLAAQWAMARWALGSFIAAVFSAVFTGAGVVLIWRTLEYTKHTLTEAKATTKAAQETVTVTRDIGEAQVRAYVSIKSAIISFLRDFDYPTVIIVASNTGQSPARNFVCGATVRYKRGDHEKRSVPSKEWQRGPGESIPVGGEREIACRTIPIRLSQEDVDRLMDRPMGPHVEVCIEFQFFDVFKAPISDVAYFRGIVMPRIVPEGEQRSIFDSDWVCELDPVAKPKGWE